MKLKIAQIRTDGGTQPRAQINEAIVAEYADALTEGAKLPEVVVFHDGADYWLADGFHRFHANRKIGALDIDADVHQGTKRDAVLYSVGANNTHGLRRTNEDKRNAVLTLLKDAEWSEWPQRKIADACGVSREFVSRVSSDLGASCDRSQDARRTVERGGKVYQQNTANIGKVPIVAPAKEKRSIATPPEGVPSANDELAEARHAITDLAAENESLRDRLAVEQMDASEEGKAEAATTISELRERVRTLEAENDALKASRDTYMQKVSEMQKQIAYWRKQAEKAA